MRERRRYQKASKMLSSSILKSMKNQCNTYARKSDTKTKEIIKIGDEKEATKQFKSNKNEIKINANNEPAGAEPVNLWLRRYTTTEKLHFRK